MARKKSVKQKKGLVEHIQSLGGRVIEVDDFKPDCSCAVIVFKYEKDFLGLLGPKINVFKLGEWFMTVGDDWTVYSFCRKF